MTRWCGHEYDVRDDELTPEERTPRWRTLGAVAEVDATLPLLPFPSQRPIEPSYARPDAFWFVGLIPWWMGGALVVWGVLFDAHNFAAAALLSAVVCGAVLGYWLSAAKAKRDAHDLACRRYEQALEDAQARLRDREQMLAGM